MTWKWDESKGRQRSLGSSPPGFSHYPLQQLGTMIQAPEESLVLSFQSLQPSFAGHLSPLDLLSFGSSLQLGDTRLDIFQLDSFDGPVKHTLGSPEPDRRR